MSTHPATLGDLLFGQTRGRVLALLYGHPDQTFYLREIARHANTSAGNVRRELETLSRLGLAHRSTSGKQVYFQANRSHPAFGEIHSLIAKTVGVFQLLGAALAAFGERISLAFVYGSIARQDENAASDVDLMIVGNVPLDEVLTALAPVEGSIGRPINPTVYSASEFDSKVQSGNHFILSVLRGEKVILMGGPDESGKMG